MPPAGSSVPPAAPIVLLPPSAEPGVASVKEGNTAEVLNHLPRSTAAMAASSDALAPAPLPEGGLPGVAQPQICCRYLVKGGFFKGGKHRCRSVGERISCRHCTKMHKKCRPARSRRDCVLFTDDSSFLGSFAALLPRFLSGSSGSTGDLSLPRL